MDDLVKAGKVRCYGVSVERVEEALKAIEYPGVTKRFRLFQYFRQRPADLFFVEAKKRNVGLLARFAVVVRNVGSLTEPIFRCESSVIQSAR